MTPSVRTHDYGDIKFSVYANEPHSRPHGHVWMGGHVVAIIDLLTGEFLETPPAGRQRKIRKAFEKVQGELIQLWIDLHKEV